MDTTITRTRLEGLLDERSQLNKLREQVLAKIQAREPGHQEADEAEAGQLEGYRTRAVEVDAEIEKLTEDVERDEKAASTSRRVRAALAGQAPGVVDDNGEVKYRTFAAYARDELIVRYPKIANLAGGPEVQSRAKERLSRAPEHTLSDDVDGLIPPQHITQILEVIDRSRPVVQSATRVTLERGQVTFPHVDQKPEVLLQETEKTEGGTANMQISMSTLTAQTFIGGGNLSWQAINWSTPDALRLWFEFAGEQYARKTEGTAAAVLLDCGTANRLGTADQIGTASTFQDWINGVVLGFAEVYENSGAMANTLYLSPDMFFLAAALTSDAGAVLISPGGLTLNTLGGNIAGIRVVTSYGFPQTTAIVGDANAFIVAETSGAPVELRAVEPAIGGLEVGVIGAFAAGCYDDSRFAQIS